MPKPFARVVASVALASLLVGGAACVGAPDPVDGVTAAGDLSVTEIVTGLDGPTQLTRLPDGRLLVAELAGRETAGTGRVVAIEPEGGEREVLFDGLLTPTGVAVIGDEIWVMEQRRLSRGPIGGGALTPVLGPLPFNGRSESTLTVTPEGGLLYGTSGSLSRGEPAEGSGILWEHDPGDPDGASTPVSAGFKNAYGHTFDDEGGLWVTEISDGSFDGSPAPDELVAVTPGVDHGWPRCIGDRVAVEQFGGTVESCAGGPPSQALFGPGATPTSVAVAPWDADTLLVALWVPRRVVAVPRSPTDIPHEPIEVLGGELRPQHLLADGDRLLVVDFDGGRILAVEAGSGS